MQPINYEQHCATCHKLEFSGKLAVGGALPHTEPQIVWELLRDRLLRYADKHPEDIDPALTVLSARLGVIILVQTVCFVDGVQDVVA